MLLKSAYRARSTWTPFVPTFAGWSIEVLIRPTTKATRCLDWSRSETLCLRFDPTCSFQSCDEHRSADLKVLRQTTACHHQELKFQTHLVLLLNCYLGRDTWMDSIWHGQPVGLLRSKQSNENPIEMTQPTRCSLPKVVMGGVSNRADDWTHQRPEQGWIEITFPLPRSPATMTPDLPVLFCALHLVSVPLPPPSFIVTPWFALDCSHLCSSDLLYQ